MDGDSYKDLKNYHQQAMTFLQQAIEVDEQASKNSFTKNLT